MSHGVVLLHDIAHPHTAAHTVQTLEQLHYEVLEYPPYNSDLALSGYHLSGPLKNASRGCHFASDHEKKEEMHA
jgi:hypothetical protein